MLAKRKACCHVAEAFLCRLKLIWLISSQNVQELLFWQKAPGVNGLNKVVIIIIIIINGLNGTVHVILNKKEF